MTGQTYQPDTGKLRTKLKENVENYAKSREIELGEAQQTVLNTYLEQAAEQYVRATKIPFIEYYGRIHSFAEKVITVGILGCLVFADVHLETSRDALSSVQHTGIGVDDRSCSGIFVACTGLSAACDRTGIFVPVYGDLCSERSDDL